MKVTLNTQNVRAFLDASRVVPTDKSDIQPILKYILFKIEWNICTIIKSNYFAFCKTSFLCENQDCEFLIGDDVLRVFISTLKSSSFKINIDGCSVQLLSENDKMKSPNGDYDSKIYHTVPQESKETFTISKEVLSWLKYSANFLPKDEFAFTFGSAYIQNNTITASDGNKIFLRKLDGAYPDTCFSASEIRAISQFNSVEFSKADNFNTYKNSNIILGFVKRDNQTPWSYERFYEVERADTLTLKADDLLNFCTSVKNFGKDIYAHCIFAVKDGKILISYSSDDGSKEYKSEFNTESNLEFSFKFVTENIDKILCDYPYEFINIGLDGHSIVIKAPSDNKFFAITQNLA